MASPSPFGGADHQQDPDMGITDLSTAFEEDDEFVDALEQQAGLDQPMQDAPFEQQNDLRPFFSGLGGPSYDENSNFTHTFQSQQDHNHVGSDAKLYNEIDLMPAVQPSKKKTRYDPNEEMKENIQVNKTSGTEAHTAAYQAVLKKLSAASQGQHAPDCSGSRGASTPPPASPTTPPLQIASRSASGPSTQPDSKAEPQQEEKVWLGPDDLRDVSRTIVAEKRWHNKVAHLHPAYPLAEHRYWIGVLNRGLHYRTACKESHFTWMKGNRLTTVETVRKSYEQTTMLEGGIFMTGGEKPNDGDRMEELDHFNDKIVLFRIAEPETESAVGRAISMGLVTKEQVAKEPAVFIEID